LTVSEELVKILETARLHAERLAEDVSLCSTRAEHVRVTARANEAASLVGVLEEVVAGYEPR